MTQPLMTDNAAASVRVTRLSNGLTVATDTVPTVETATIGVWIAAGARSELPEHNGVAHLLEHMAFKGTERRSARIIAETIEAVGGQMNAYTSRESTAYFARVLKEDAPLAVDILADIMMNSLFDADELGRERSVVLQEIGQAIDTPDDIIFDYFQQAAYPGQALGRPVLGSPDTVRGLSRKDVIGYMQANYRGPSMILAASGNVDHDAIVTLAERSLGSLGAEMPREPDAARYIGGEFREARSLEQLHLLMGFAGVSHRDPDYYAMTVLSSLLGGSMSSRLFQEVREERGLVYSIHTFGASYMDGGLFGVYAGTGDDLVGELVPVVCDSLCRVCEDVTGEEVERAKAQMKAGLLMSMESTMARAEQLAQNLIVFGRPVATQEYVQRIEAVTPEDVMRVAAQTFRGDAMTLASMGPVDALEDYDQIVARLA